MALMLIHVVKEYEKSPVFLSVVIISLWVTACGQIRTPPDMEARETVQAVTSSRHFISDPAPQPIPTRLDNPLDYAAGRIGLDLGRLELPRGEEVPYRFVCGLPVIDLVSNHPLYLKQWTEEGAATINGYHRKRGLKTVTYVTDLLRGTDNTARNTYGDAGNIAGEVADVLSRLPYTNIYKKELRVLLRAYFAACQLVGEARAGLTDEDLAFFQGNPAYYLVPDGEKMLPVTGDVSSQERFVERARRVRYENIFSASLLLTDAIQHYIERTRDFDRDDFFVDAHGAVTTYSFSTPYGRLVFSGHADDNHQRDAALLIDHGGNDAYVNNAGGSHGQFWGVAVSIDHSGDDHYTAPDRNYIQGFGFLGIGILVDLSGNDRYEAGNFSQGSGIMGVGVIFDSNGDDRYDGNTFCQGAGMFGAGVLMDSEGNDRYDAAMVAQGAATTLGVGVLTDLAGDDQYGLAVDQSKDYLQSDTQGYGQGGALSFRPWPFIGKLTAYGGMGILTDFAGDDSYRAGGWSVQGGSYLMSLGALVDDNGNDHYQNSRGGGSAIHASSAILIDKNGDDRYETEFLGFGSGSDRSTGIFIDYRGNDSYGGANTTGSFGAGCKPLGFSLFIDYEGDDVYECKQPTTYSGHDWDCCGGVWPESRPYLWPHAIFLDLSGKDRYHLPHRADNSERFSFGHGIHLDTEWQAPHRAEQGYGDVIRERAAPKSPAYSSSDKDGSDFPVYYQHLLLLRNKDLFIRFQAIGRLLQHGTESVPHLVHVLTASEDRRLNRDLLEVIHYFFYQDKIKEGELPPLLGLLKAKDEEVRAVMVHNLGLWEIKESEFSLVDALKDPSERVRRFSLVSLRNLKSSKGIRIARDLALLDPSDEVRRAAVSYLSDVAANQATDVLIEALEKDRSPSVRYAAAEGFGRFREPLALAPLREAARSEDYYLRRAAARGLALLYEKEAIEILIDSMSFPSIDVGDNYGKNIPNYIAAFSGVDIPDRYDRNKWKEWYRKNRDTIDMKRNVDAYLESAGISAIPSVGHDKEEIPDYKGLGKY